MERDWSRENWGGWLNGWLNGWVNGWVNGWLVGWLVIMMLLMIFLHLNYVISNVYYMEVIMSGFELDSSLQMVFCWCGC